MATSTPPGLSPSEIAFLCELELVTVLPRQRLDSLKLLGGTTPALRPPHRTALPLWLALLLKRQRRADIVPPPWLHASALSQMLEKEISDPQPGSFNPAPPLNSNTTPPFQPSSLADGPADSLPYHWLEMGQLLLAEASDDIVDAEAVRRLLRDLREVRMSKLRGVFGDRSKGGNSNKTSTAEAELKSGGGIKLDGIGAMEVGETRAFIGGVVDGLRKIGASREATEKERAEEDAERGGFDGGADDDDEDMLM